MSEKKPLRVLFCMGVNQNFMDGTADEMKDVWGAFVSMMQGIARLPGVRVLGNLDDDRIMVGPSVAFPWTTYVLADVPNRLTIEGHTDAKPFVGGEAGYSNWELSADRANASRRELIAGGLKGENVLRVQGLAASMLFDAQNPESPLNRRISIIVMNREAEERFYEAARTASGTSSNAEDETEATPEGSLPPGTGAPNR